MEGDTCRLAYVCMYIITFAYMRRCICAALSVIHICVRICTYVYTSYIGGPRLPYI